MSVVLTFICDLVLDADSTCGRRFNINVDPVGDPAAMQLRAAGWTGMADGGQHRCSHHSGVPQLPTRVPSRTLDVPSAARGVPIPTNVTPFRRPHA